VLTFALQKFFETLLPDPSVDICVENDVHALHRICGRPNTSNQPTEKRVAVFVAAVFDYSVFYPIRLKFIRFSE
jgi:hypothetical protein